jgi:3D (Asp-Asp-Asp) domain-containing protein/DNA-binding transcriptional ArsR family regulator
VLALAVGTATASAGPGTGYRRKAAQLQVEAQKLDTRTHLALLGLYAVDARLGSARARLAALESRAASLRKRRLVLAQQLDAAHKTLVVSQQQLGQHLRSLYEQGDVDPLAVVLGARSLEDALTRLDDLTRLADQGRRVVAVTSAAEFRLARARTALARQQRRLSAAVSAARGAERELAAAQADRLSLVAGLQAEQRLKQDRIRSLLATAHAVELKSQQIQASAATAAAVGESEPAPPGQPVERGQVGRTITVSATGYSLPGHTATGLPVGWGVVAVDPAVIPLGTKLTIPGYGEGVAADVGSGVHGAMIDLWFPSLAQARAWGLRTVTITLH